MVQIVTIISSYLTCPCNCSTHGIINYPFRSMVWYWVHLYTAFYSHNVRSKSNLASVIDYQVSPCNFLIIENLELFLLPFLPLSNTKRTRIKYLNRRRSSEMLSKFRAFSENTLTICALAAPRSNLS